ncbi:MAG: tripartite tricarboxylate transporter substrate binding protein, partial [Burkholderiales bacterium]
MSLLRVLVSAVALTLSAGVAAQEFPAKPIRIVVPFATGGVTDTSARALADKLSLRFGQQVIVENRPGASGNPGTAFVAQA